ncbi:U32 family peptidase [uncultured Eubacterium sp.]|uniref:peptidase U32 family protein n=1 Tax=uncultured Eubacterium sp. TaxID=165185 RepID=UPI0015A8D49A|nr:U32 family peptidase [uncultured Eubacterium sp.]
MRRHELLSPAGSLEICKAVLNAGADAVYLGGDKFGARAFAKNFTQNDIQEALDFAHMRGKKIFLTVNTLLKNKEIETELFSYLKPLYAHGLDAVIVQDYGVFQFIHRNFPELALHASTQMSVSNVSGAKFLMEHGAERIVTARELSRLEIRRIYDETGVEIESFIHGALCYCYSGQCLMSSMLGGRSGNRGRCAQPCRLAYQVTDERGNLLHKKEKYPLSPKDLCTISQLPQLCESGIYSFKIEGRMKKLEYAAGVTSVYRKYLDLYESCPEHYRVEDADMERLLAFGNRNGFTAGYYDMRNGRSMMTLTDSSHSSNEAKAAYQAPEETKVPVALKAVFHAGKPMQLEVALSRNDTEAESHSEKKVCVSGEIPGTAQNRPLSEDELRKRLSKTGDTPFCVQHLEIDLEDGLFVPVGQINELRRNALEQLQQAMLCSWRRNEAVTPQERPTDRMEQNKAISSGDKPMLNVWLIGSAQQNLNAVLENQMVDMVTLDSFTNLEAALKEIHAAGKQAGYAFPYVLRENSEGLLRKQVSVLKRFDRIWVRSYDGIGFAKEELHLPAEKLALDAGLYVFSNEAADDFMAAGFAGYTASMELNRKELAHMENEQAELMLYGYAPLMISAQCVYKNYASCIKEQKKESGKQPQRLYLNDRYQKQFEVQRDCTNCYNVIYNSQPTCLLHHADEIGGLDFGAHRIVFRNESVKQMHGILQQYEDAFRSGRKIQPPKEGTYTNGHFRRGVD